MKFLTLSVVLLGLSMPALASDHPKKNTTKFFSQTGKPEGRAVTQGKTTRFYNQNGKPQGKATTQGNTTRYTNQSGKPQGRSVSGR